MGRAAAPAPPGAEDLAAHSRFAQRVRRRYAAERALLVPGGMPSAAAMRDCLATLQARGFAPDAALRVLRQLVLERVLTLDCTQRADLGAVEHTMTSLAEIALDSACVAADAELRALHGAPAAADGAPVHFWVVGMGKLGGRELNVSSDVDLVYLYDHDGTTAGRADGGGAIANREYFTRMVRRLNALIADVSEHGFVFRVDLALRPNGNAGPAVTSLEALREYMQVHGREWERFAWLKSRVVAPRAALADRSARALRGVVLPFVFRRYLDYNVFDALRALHEQIRDYADRRCAGRPARANDVKLSRGGIREIEFTVQLPQLVRGGQFPELRTRSTLVALQRLVRAQLMTPEVARRLADAYTFLRRTEHRIQYLDDQQTHILPSRGADLDWIARTLGYRDAVGFLAQFGAHREFVAEQFDQLLGAAAAAPATPPKAAARDDGAAAPKTVAHADARVETEHLRERLRTWRTELAEQELPQRVLDRVAQLMERTVGWMRAGVVGESGVLRFVDWLDSLLRRDSYLALLQERPAVHERVLRVLDAARWPAVYLTQHPGVIDELASPDLLAGRFQPALFERILEARRDALRRTGEDTEENLLNLLRRAHHAVTFRTLVRDVEGHITVEQVADDLSALADAILRLALRWCWPLVRHHHRPVPQLGLIAYGKLGGKELGYGSDLDLVFVFDDEDERAPEIYAALVRKLILWITTKTAEGELYEIDTALRPNGNSGLLVTRFDAFADYQQRRGSNTAWTWEHQAMTRARMVPAVAPDADAADPTAFDLAPRFDAIRHAVITAPRDCAALRAEIVAMRATMRKGRPVPPGRFDIKQSPGGLVDAEFVTQYLVLAHSAVHPELEPNLGNIALLGRAEAAGLLPAGCGYHAGAAYRSLRHAQHRTRLNELSTTVSDDMLAEERAAITALWQSVFGTAAE